jgi:hypothetical protein
MPSANIEPVAGAETATANVLEQPSQTSTFLKN